MIPAAHPYYVKRHRLGERDAHGKREVTYGDPEQLMAYSVAPATGSEDTFAGRDAVEAEVTIYGQHGDTVDAADRIILDGIEFEVIGGSRDWSKSPFPMATFTGITINLKRWEG